jgi:hypothetical protein
MSSLAVFDIEHGTASSVRSLEDHSVNRTEDGWSAIDTSRSHLNRTLVGANGPSASLKAWYERTEARRPTAQAETPYYQLVLSASPEHPPLSGMLSATLLFSISQVGGIGQ